MLSVFFYVLVKIIHIKTVNHTMQLQKICEILSVFYEKYFLIDETEILR